MVDAEQDSIGENNANGDNIGLSTHFKGLYGNKSPGGFLARQDQHSRNKDSFLIQLLAHVLLSMLYYHTSLISQHTNLQTVYSVCCGFPFPFPIPYVEPAPSVGKKIFRNQ